MCIYRITVQYSTVNKLDQARPGAEMDISRDEIEKAKDALLVLSSLLPKKQTDAGKILDQSCQIKCIFDMETVLVFK